MQLDGKTIISKPGWIAHMMKSHKLRKKVAEELYEMTKPFGGSKKLINTGISASKTNTRRRTVRDR